MLHGTLCTSASLPLWATTRRFSSGTRARATSHSPRRACSTGTWPRSIAWRSTRSPRTLSPRALRTKRWRFGISATSLQSSTPLRTTPTRCFRPSGRRATRPSSARARPTVVCTFGTSRASALSRASRTQRTGRPSCCLSTAATPQRSRTLRGTRTSRGWRRRWPRTTFCRSGRWLSTSTATRRPSTCPRLRSSERAPTFRGGG
eukprot:Amastigsp_a696591_10.p2 type:complete len:204 gc:universal Amastigsp_a696591_10:630-19(-)